MSGENEPDEVDVLRVEDTPTADFLIRRLPNGDFEISETAWSLTLRQIGTLAKLYFYGDADSDAFFEPTLLSQPNQFGLAVLNYCGKIPARESPEYESFMKEMYADLLNHAGADGLRQWAELEAVLRGWNAWCADRLREEQADLEAILGPHIRDFKGLQDRCLNFLYGPTFLMRDPVLCSEVEAYTGLLREAEIAVRTSKRSIDAIFEARRYARFLDSAAKRWENSFMSTAGWTSPKLGAGKWPEICFLFWSVRVLGEKGPKLAKHLFRKKAREPSATWRPVRRLLLKLASAISQGPVKSTVLGGDFTPYIVHLVLHRSEQQSSGI